MRSILAAEVFKRGDAVLDADARVKSRDTRRIDLYRGFWRTANDAGPVHQEESAVIHRQMEPGSRRTWSVLVDRHVTDEPISDSVNRPDEKWRINRIAEVPSNLRHQARDVRLLDERLGPQALLKIGLRYDIWPVRQQDAQELEPFRRKMKLAVR